MYGGGNSTPCCVVDSGDTIMLSRKNMLSDTREPMNEPQPMLGYLLIAFLTVAGTAVIVLARKIYEFYRRTDEMLLGRVKYGRGIFKFLYTLQLSISPEMHVLNIRFSGALMIAFAMILLGLAIRANL
jgi:hypothetical protein